MSVARAFHVRRSRWEIGAVRAEAGRSPAARALRARTGPGVPPGHGRLTKAMLRWSSLALSSVVLGGGPVDSRLAAELASEGDHAGAAVEYRRLALAADHPDPQGGYYWAAAHEYWRDGRPDDAERMLDRAENLGGGIGVPALLLRAENAEAARDLRGAAFHWQTVLGGTAGAEARRFAARRLAMAELRSGDAQAALAALEMSPGDEREGRMALARYRSGNDRRPWVGGLLGLVPGLGHAYSGEYASGARSLILNGLFIWAMTWSAREDQWGAFAVAGFFELTWYGGSVYGGIDAAHRFNRRRLEEAAEEIGGGAAFAPDYPALPVVQIKFSF